MSLTPESSPEPWWKKPLRYLAYGAAVVLLGAAAWGLLWHWPQQGGKDLELPEKVTKEATFEQELQRTVEVEQLEKDRVATGAQLFLGLGVLAGLVLTWLRIRVTDKQATAALKSAQTAETQAKTANRNAEIAQGQLELTRRQQTAERFTKAVEQLGDGRLNIRLGGIYALEKIARDEPKEYFSLFREILCAFVRDSTKASRGRDENGEHIPPPTDVQTALTVLGRYPPPEDGRFVQINWAGAHLESANLFRAHLETAHLKDTHLEGARLTEAHLKDAVLASAHLNSASLVKAELVGTRLRAAHLENSDLRFAQLNGAHLIDSHLEDADLRHADLKGADLSHAHLKGARYDLNTQFPAGFESLDDMIVYANWFVSDPGLASTAEYFLDDYPSSVPCRIHTARGRSS